MIAKQSATRAVFKMRGYRAEVQEGNTVAVYKGRKLVTRVIVCQPCFETALGILLTPAELAEKAVQHVEGGG